MSDSFIKMCGFVNRTPRKLVPGGLSVAAERNSKTCRKLLRAFAEIHNSLRSNNGFLLITQLPANQEFLLCLHMKPGWNQLVGLDVVMKWIPMIAERYLI